MVDPWAGYNQSLNVLSHAAGMAQNDKQRQFTNALAEKQDERAESGQQFNQGIQSRAESRLLEDRPFERGLKESAEKRAGESHDQSTQINNLNMGVKKLETIGKILDPVTNDAQYQQAKQQLAGIFGPEFAAKMQPNFDPNVHMEGKKKFEQEMWNMKKQLVEAQIANQKAQATKAATTKTKDGRSSIGKEIDDLSEILGKPRDEVAKMIRNDKQLGTKLKIYTQETAPDVLYGSPEETEPKKKEIAKRLGVYDAVFGGDKTPAGYSPEEIRKSFIQEYSVDPAEKMMMKSH